MATALSRHEGRLEMRLFTDRERAYCRGKANAAQHFAARFAAKEAFLKALRVPEGLSWHEAVGSAHTRLAPSPGTSSPRALARVEALLARRGWTTGPC